MEVVRTHTSFAQRSIDFFFEESQASKFRDRPRVTLPWKLNDDLIKYSGTKMTLKNADDLWTLRVLAHDRKEWTDLVEKIATKKQRSGK